MTIDEFKASLEDLKKELLGREQLCNNTIIKLSSKLKDDVKDIIDLQAEVISYRQLMIEDIKQIAYKVYKDLPKIKELRKKTFEFYTLSYNIKTNGTEKAKLMEADLAYYDYKIDIYNTHMEFLKETVKNLDNLNYAIKNKIELVNYLGM